MKSETLINRCKPLTAIVLFFLSEIAVAQEKQPVFTPKTNENSLSFEPASFSYSYAHAFQPHVTFGASVHVGMALLIQINVMNSNSSGIIAPRFEMSKFQLYYRRYFKPTVYTDVGGYFSLGYYPESIPNGDFEFFAPSEYSIGVFTSVFYGFKKIKFGHEVQLGLLSENYYGNDKNKLTLLIVPVVIRYDF